MMAWFLMPGQLSKRSVSSMLIICVTTIGLVSWALHLMQRAVDDQDFSFMLAGLLVVCAAGALLSVYFLMENYWTFIDQVSTHQATMSFATPNGSLGADNPEADLLILLSQ